MEGVNEVFILVSAFFALITGGLTFFFTLRYSKRKAVSSAKKDIQLNTAEGNDAEANFIDRMIDRGEQLAEKIYKEQIKKQEAEALTLAYKLAFRHLYISCEESCVDSENCKKKLNEVMRNFNLEIERNDP